ncbi:hypothetical protein G3O08_12735 [Cryomorpha ignava]|uniref:Uncharacterized protein n=1 Tax=Cryomorpha ignava TaxID=101383 RepID=A0A7K3WU08_9FLAO|nr:hypothetical protein [Cryomorpha ignava]NEN24372.1 hypothetical protein [Cryomorpha ignava]
MKNILKITFLFVCLLSLSQCKEDDDKPEEPNYGAEYFKCKVNGVEFDAHSTFSCDGRKFNYYPEAYLSTPAQYMVFGGRNCSEFSSVTIRINGMDHSTGLLNFLAPTHADSIFPYYSYFDLQDSVFVIAENLVEGEMNIEQFIPRVDGSSPYGTIKGTFNFTVTDENAVDTFRITNGQFRFDVPQIF